VKNPHLKNWSADWHKIFCTSSDRLHGFVGGQITLNYKSKMAADAMLNFR